MVANPKDMQKKLMRGLLDFTVLQFLKGQPMHGYQVISTLRTNFGVYFGPSTIYPLLSTLEEKGYIESKWDFGKNKPRKVYTLSPQGEDMLNCTKVSLNFIYRKLENGLNKAPLNTAWIQ